ncbi:MULTISPECIES: DMT family transporter [unclassified Aurantimonas]|uniref:DMT family transporter n=1 Tax=unclassified Aurantimonas TaxID=2638230 RepID=UPI002E191AD1|nr:DMT family transporter [Aurantimonas sp. A3-2-R12]
MTVSGFVLVLAAAFCHATWNFLVKKIRGGPELIWLFTVVTLVLYLPPAVYVVATNPPDFGPWEIGFILGSTGLHLGYILLLQRGYRDGDLSIVYPTARATGPFLATIFAVTMLGEPLTWQIALGAIVIIAGVLFLSGGLKRGSKSVTASILFGVSVGLLIASYTVWDAYAVTALLIPPLLLDYASSIGRVMLLTPYALRRRAMVTALWTHHRGSVIAIAVLSPLAYILVLYALTFTPIIYVAPTRELSVVLTVLMGSLLLREGQLRHRLFWAAVILGGVVLLATG